MASALHPLSCFLFLPSARLHQRLRVELRDIDAAHSVTWFFALTNLPGLRRQGRKIASAVNHHQNQYTRLLD
ncbi:MAG: hypothetical protein ACRDF4_03570, partial [Rhabdochlamydiaceae bacterium]